VPEYLQGVRALFSSFHHFRPDQARGILQDAVNKRASIAVFELANRSFMAHLHTLLSPIALAIYTPTLSPIKLSRFLFTYLLPIIPILVIWDGIASNFRNYSPEELNELILSVDGHEGFECKTGTKKGPLFGSKITYLTGVPIVTRLIFSGHPSSGNGLGRSAMVFRTTSIVSFRRFFMGSSIGRTPPRKPRSRRLASPPVQAAGLALGTRPIR
jgi:hypothetical protein